MTTANVVPCDGRARALVDAHFRGRIAPDAERAMRAHVTDCAACRSYYERHMILAEIDPRAKREGAEARIARGLGLLPSRSWLGGAPSRALRVAPLAWAACAAAIALFAIFPKRHHDANDFTARGVTSMGEEARVFVYRMQPLARLDEARPDGDRQIRKNDALAFAYTNPRGYEHLLVFGVDEHRHVYWYYPAWTNAAEDPRAIAIDGGRDTRELPHAIRHDLDGQTLTIFAVFTHDEPSVRGVEAIVAAHDPASGPLRSSDAFEQRVALTVIP
jgi:hypothetical protein